MAAGEDQQGVTLAGETTPIAQLSPDLPDQATRLIRGEVTVIWPYSSVNKTIAFLLAEPDARLRRVKGLVRIQLHGPCAKAVADCGIGGGDLVTLSLDGAEWEKDTDGTPARPPGSRLEWQLKLTRRLVAKVESSETREIKTIDIDQLAQEPEGLELAAVTASILEAEPESQNGPERRPANQYLKRHPVEEVQPNLYSSPALLKRERVSWGGLLDEELRMFEEDGSVKGRGRKRPKYGRYSGTWRYRSASGSPNPESEHEDQASVTERTAETPPQSSPTPRPQMMDEGCQTIELDFSPIPVPQSVYQSLQLPPSEAATPSKPQGITYPMAPLANMDSGVQTYDVGHLPDASIQNEPPRLADSMLSSEVAAPDSSHFSGFLPSNAAYAMPRFQTASTGTSFGEPQLSLGDQVRFGFSHKPQPVFEPMPPADHMGDVHPAAGQGDYPESFLDQHQHGVPVFPATDSTQDHHSPQQQGPSPHHASPASYHMEQGSSIPLWPITSQSLDSNHAAAHLDVNAPAELAEAAHPTGDDVRSNGSEPEEPESAVLSEEAVEAQQRETEAEPIYRQGGERLADAAADAEDDLDEGDEYDDDYLSGEHDEEYEAEDRIGADYDMRNYADYEDDLDGEDTREHLGLVPDAEAIDEDEDEDDDEDEEGSYDEEDEADYDDTYAAPRRSALPPGPPPAKTAPVVIDLISDSEDEDEQGTPAHAVSRPPIVKEGTADEKAGFEEGAEEEGDEDEDEYGEEDGEGEEFEEFEDESEGSENEVDARYPGETQANRDVEGSPSRDAAAAGPDASSDIEADPGGASGAEVSPSQEVQSAGEGDGDGDGDGEPGDEHDASGEREPSELLDEEEEELAEKQREEGKAKAEGPSDATRLAGEPASSEKHQGEEIAATEPEHGAESNVDNVEADRQSEDADVTPRPEAVITAGPQPASVPAPQTGEDAEQLGKTARDTPMREASPEARRRAGTPAQQLEGPAMDIDADRVRLAEEGDEDMADAQEGAPSVGGDQSMADADEVRSAADRDESMVDAEEAPPSLDEDMASVRTVEPFADEDDDMASVRTVEPAREKDEDMADIASVEPQRATDALADEALDERREDVVMAPSSPPLTQPFESQVVVKGVIISTTEEIVLVDAHEADNLLTPLDTQTSEAVVHTETLVEEEGRAQVTVEPSSTQELQEAVDVVSSSGVVDVEEAAGRPGEDATEQPDTGGHLADEPTSDGRNEAGAALTPPEATSSAPQELAQETQAVAPEHAPEQDAKASSTEPAPETEQAQPDTEAPAPSSPSVDTQAMAVGSQPSQATAAASDEGAKDGHAAVSPELDLTEDPSVQLARAAVAAKRGRRAGSAATTSAPALDPPRTTRSAAKNQQREATPDSEGDTSVQLAKAAINSPKKSRDGEASATQLKLELSKRLRTEMPDCITLKSLRSHLNKNLDVAAVVTTVPPEPQRAKGGPRQYMMSFNVTDPSIAPLHVVEVHFFRAHKDYLPAVKPGDSVLLRSFTVVALKDKGFGLRTHEGSSWAVFDREDGLAQIRGPPVELAEHEAAYMMDVKRWYSALGEPAKAKLERANQKFAEVNGASK